jgi:hypothetical protein
MACGDGVLDIVVGGQEVSASKAHPGFKLRVGGTVGGVSARGRHSPSSLFVLHDPHDQSQAQLLNIVLFSNRRGGTEVVKLLC